MSIRRAARSAGCSIWSSRSARSRRRAGKPLWAVANEGALSAAYAIASAADRHLRHPHRRGRLDRRRRGSCRRERGRRAGRVSPGPSSSRASSKVDGNAHEPLSRARPRRRSRPMSIASTREFCALVAANRGSDRRGRARQRGRDLSRRARGPRRPRRPRSARSTSPSPRWRPSSIARSCRHRAAPKSHQGARPWRPTRLRRDSRAAPRRSSRSSSPTAPAAPKPAPRRLLQPRPAAPAAGPGPETDPAERLARRIRRDRSACRSGRAARRHGRCGGRDAQGHLGRSAAPHGARHARVARRGDERHCGGAVDACRRRKRRSCAAQASVPRRRAPDQPHHPGALNARR